MNSPNYPLSTETHRATRSRILNEEHGYWEEELEQAIQVILMFGKRADKTLRENILNICSISQNTE